MRFARLALLGLAFLFHCLASAQTITPLYPSSYLDQSGGCFSIRCFMYLQGFDGTSAITSNTGDGLGIQVRSGNPEWLVQQTLTNPDYPPPSQFPWMDPARPFGGPAAVYGNYILVTGTSSRYAFKDVVYMFARANNLWTHRQTFPLQRPAEFDRTIITDIVMDGDQALINGVRASDSSPSEMLTRVEVYKRANGLYGRRAVLPLPGDQNQYKDYELALKGTIAVVGDPDNARVHVFENRPDGWIRTRTFVSDLAANGRFGESVSLSGTTIAIAEPARVNASDPAHLGGIHVYTKRNSQWVLEQRLQTPAGYETDAFTFGFRVALSGDRLLAGNTLQENSDSFPTAAFLFERRDRWQSVATLQLDSSLVTEQVALVGSTAILRGDDFAYNNPGYVFELPLLWTLP